MDGRETKRHGRSADPRTPVIASQQATSAPEGQDGEGMAADCEGQTDDEGEGKEPAGPQQVNPNVRIVKVVPLPHARSEVWSYFGFIADDDGEIQDRKKAICKICATTLSYSGNTTNMFTHLKAMHPEATPQKLQPTNRFPRTGRKAPSKRRFLEAIANSGHLAIEYPAAGTAATGTPTLLHGGTSNSYIIRVHSTSNGGEQVLEEALSVSPDDAITPAIHQVASLPPSSVASSSPSVICVNKSLSSAAGTRTAENNAADAQSKSHSHASREQPEQDFSGRQARSNVCSAEDITNAVVDVIVKDCRPINLVHGRGFQSLLKLIAPAYQLPDHERLQSLVRTKYDDLRRELILKGMQQQIDES